MKVKLNNYVIKVNLNEPIKCNCEYAVLKPDARLWKDEYIFETDLNEEEVKNLAFVKAIIKPNDSSI